MAEQVSEIKDSDIRIDVFRQAVPNGDWSLRLTHLPTGTVLTAGSDEYSSQLQARIALIAELPKRLAENEE